MEKIMQLFFDYFNWLFNFLEGFGVKVPQYVKDNFTTTEAPAEEETTVA